MLRLFKKTRSLPTDPILPVLAFITDFENKKFARALGHHKRTGQMLPEAIALKKALIASGLIYGRAWVYITPEIEKRFMDAALIALMNPKELQTNLTRVMRLDRLGEGFVLSAVCQNGSMLAALQRLQALHANGEIAPLLNLTDQSVK